MGRGDMGSEARQASFCGPGPKAVSTCPRVLCLIVACPAYTTTALVSALFRLCVLVACGCARSVQSGAGAGRCVGCCLAWFDEAAMLSISRSPKKGLLRCAAPLVVHVPYSPSSSMPSTRTYTHRPAFYCGKLEGGGLGHASCGAPQDKAHPSSKPSALCFFLAMIQRLPSKGGACEPAALPMAALWRAWCWPRVWGHRGVSIVSLW